MRRARFPFVASALGLLAVVVLGFGAMQQPQPAALVNASAPSAGAPRIMLDSGKAAPRQLEDTTRNAIVRDYGRAWHDMAAALQDNRADLLPASFVGVAQEKLADRIAAQQHAGLETRLIDHGHRVQAVFYSPEGSAMQLRDTAQLEMQVLEGSTVLNSEQLTVHYVVLMSVAEDHWKVRVLQETSE